MVYMDDCIRGTLDFLATPREKLSESVYNMQGECVRGLCVFERKEDLCEDVGAPVCILYVHVVYMLCGMLSKSNTKSYKTSHLSLLSSPQAAPSPPPLSPPPSAVKSPPSPSPTAPTLSDSPLPTLGRVPWMTLSHDATGGGSRRTRWISWCKVRSEEEGGERRRDGMGWMEIWK